MKIMIAGLLVLLLATLASAIDVKINLLAVDENTPAGQSAENVVITAYDADTGSVIASSVTTKQGLSSSDGADFSLALIKEVVAGRKNFYFYGMKNGAYYFESDPLPIYYVDILGGKLCTVDTNKCQSIYDGKLIIVLKALKLSKSSTVNIMARDAAGQSIGGVYLKVINSETKEILGSAVNDSNGANIELPLDKKFEITTISKDGRNYGAFQASGNGWSNVQFYLEQKQAENGINLCRLDKLTCSLERSIVLMPLDELIPKEESEFDKLLSQDGIETEYAVNLNSGWNLISIPLNQAKAIENTCGTNVIYIHDSNSQTYNTFSSDAFSFPLMQAFWIKTKEACKIKFNGLTFQANAINGFALNKGWNSIGAAGNELIWDEIKGSCKAKGSLWAYNTRENKWEKAASMVRGRGYLVNLLEECSLEIQNNAN